MKSDLMLDFETFGTSPNCVAVQIGACYFDRYTGEISAEFLRNIDVNSSVDAGFEMEPDTIKWWMGQSDEARGSLFDDPEPVDVQSAMSEFIWFVKNETNIWSHATFDFVIMMNHFKRLGLVYNISFRAARDLRTLVDLAGVDYRDETRFPRVGTHHNALDDCKFQVGYAVECFKRLRGMR